MRRQQDSAAQGPAGDVRWIDVHHHSYHPRLRRELVRRGVTHLAEHVPLPQWTTQVSLDAMDAAGISAAVTSVLLPDAVFALAPADLRGLVRLSNELSAELVRARPDRFGALAVLPLPDLDAALGEAEYALDHLRLDGVVLGSSFAGGGHPGDAQFAPLFDELDRRRAVVLIHPNPSCAACACLGGDYAARVPPGLLEFVFSSTRAVANLLYGGTLERCPGIRFVVAHAGGVLPYLVQRLEVGGTWAFADPGADGPEAVGAPGPSAARPDPRSLLRSLYYEVAQSASPSVLRCLHDLAGERRILFGTDFPIVRGEALARGNAAVSAWAFATGGRPTAERVAGANALELFPRLARAPIPAAV